MYGADRPTFSNTIKRQEPGMSAISAGVQDLPTELLCAIFELSAHLSLEAPLTVDHHTDIENCFFHCIALSQVCVVWRRIVTALQCLWVRLPLGRNAFKDDATSKEIIAAFLARSHPLPLALAIQFDARPDFIPPKNILHHSLHEHIWRCHSLRVASNDLIITAVLDAFSDISTSPRESGPRYPPLSALHLIQTSATAVAVTYASDLNFVAPNLISLRIEGAAVCEYPRRYLQDAVLEDIYLPYKCHFTLFEKSVIRRLTLRKIRISGEPPYVTHRFIDASKSSVTSLVLSDVRCSGPPPYHPNIYGTFFTMSIYPNLQELELSHLNNQCVSGLVVMLRAQSPLLFAELRKLTLHNFLLTQDAATTITNSFTAVTEVVMDTLRDSQWFIENLWVVSRRQLVWPLLEEIQLDGVTTQRLDQ